MSNYKLYSACISAIHDEVFIIYALKIFGVYTMNIKDLISNFLCTQQDKASNNQNNLIQNRNQ